MPELERFRLTRTMLMVPFGFNLFMVGYFLLLSFFLMLGVGPYGSASLEWQLLTFLPPASFVVNGLSIPLFFITLQKDLRREPQVSAQPSEGTAVPPGRDMLFWVFLLAGLLCTGMLYVFVFIPSIWGWLTGSF